MIRGADLSHADICEISTELEAEENLDPQPPGHVHHHRRGRLRRQLSEAHRHPSPTVLSHQRDWPGRDVGADSAVARYGPLAGLRHSRIHANDCADCETSTAWFDHIDRDVELTGDLDDTQRQRLLHIAERCPVHQTLTSEVHVATSLTDRGHPLPA